MKQKKLGSVTEDMNYAGDGQHRMEIEKETGKRDQKNRRAKAADSSNNFGKISERVKNINTHFITDYNLLL